MKLIYIAGAYRAATQQLVRRNVKVACEAAQDLLRLGYALICPHSMTHGWEECSFLTEDMFRDNGLEQMRRCDAVLVVGTNWRGSDGTLAEIAEAKRLGIPVFHERTRLLMEVAP